MSLEIQVGEPTVPGRYVVWTPCRALQVREWCEPSIASWHDGRWHSYEPVWGWIGPLPVVHGNDCLKKIPTIVATNADDAMKQIQARADELWPEGEPTLTPAEENELVDRINGSPNLQPNPKYDL